MQAGKMQLDWSELRCRGRAVSGRHCNSRRRAAVRRAGNFGGDSHAAKSSRPKSRRSHIGGVGEALRAKRLGRPAVSLSVGRADRAAIFRRSSSADGWRSRSTQDSQPGDRSLHSETLADVVQIWVPLVNCLEPKPGFPDFCDDTPPLDAYAREANPARACGSISPAPATGATSWADEYFTGWPSYMIDVPGTANRVMQWMAWKYPHRRASSITA